MTEKQNFSPGTMVRRNSNNTIQFLKISVTGNHAGQAEHSSSSPEDIALTFIERYRQQFVLQNPARELRCLSVSDDDLGMTHVRFQQIYSGISIWGAEVNVHLDTRKTVSTVQGRYIPTPTHLSIHPALNEDQVLEIVSRISGIPETGLKEHTPELVIYQNSSTPAVLAYKMMLPGWIYFIDAESGKIVDRIATRQTGNFDILEK